MRLEPQGDEPQAVYWRRRALALGIAIAVVIFGVWGVALAVGGENPEDEVAALRAASEARVSNPPSSMVPISPSSSMSSASNTSTTTSPPPSSSTPPAPPPPPPGPPPVCPNEALKVTAEVGRPEYRVGQRPEFRLVVTNISPQPCVRQLDPQVQEILVTSPDGANRIWSSNDCYPGKMPDLRTLAPGEPAVFRLAWAGRTSAPGCAIKRKTVPAGNYVIVAKVDNITSQPTPFRLV